MTTYCYTALLDVLAYRNRLQQDINSGEYSLKEDLETSLSVLDNIDANIFTIHAISDTIIISCERHENLVTFIETLRTIFLAFLQRGLYIRGGVAYSKHFESGRLTYSHAVAKAYELESQQAIYPRIVFDNNIIQMYGSAASLPELFGQKLLCHQNNVYFLNIFTDENWEDAYNWAKETYQRDVESSLLGEGPFAKHQWFENFLFSSPCRVENKSRYINGIEIL